MIEHLLAERGEEIGLHAGPGAIADEAHGGGDESAHGKEKEERRHLAAFPCGDHAVDQVAKRKGEEAVEGHFQKQAKRYGFRSDRSRGRRRLSRVFTVCGAARAAVTSWVIRSASGWTPDPGDLNCSGRRDRCSSVEPSNSPAAGHGARAIGSLSNQTRQHSSVADAPAIAEEPDAFRRHAFHVTFNRYVPPEKRVRIWALVCVPYRTHRSRLCARWGSDARSRGD